MVDIAKLLAEKSGIRLDIGCGENKQDDNFVGLDVRKFDCVDIVHDINVHPWPLPDECVSLAVASHLVEHIPRVVLGKNGETIFPFFDFMNEVWRIMQVGGQFAIAMPYATSQGFYQDPTHVNPCNHITWAYFDPKAYSAYGEGTLYNIYKPKPWEIKNLAFDPAANMEILLVKRKEEEDEPGREPEDG